MTILADKSRCPVCVGKTFIVSSVARNQSFPCGGCYYRPMVGKCSRPCNSSWETRPFTNFKRVHDGEIVRNAEGKLFICHKSDVKTMVLIPKAKEK